jgi:hypothetical protein
MEGTVVSVSHQTLVLRSDDNRFQLFTYERPSVPPVSLAQGVRVRVTAGAADENGVRIASNVQVVTNSGTAAERMRTVSYPTLVRILNLRPDSECF